MLSDLPVANFEAVITPKHAAVREKRRIRLLVRKTQDSSQDEVEEDRGDRLFLFPQVTNPMAVFSAFGMKICLLSSVALPSVQLETEGNPEVCCVTFLKTARATF